MIQEMDSDAGMTARPDFTRNASVVRCSFCSNPDSDIRPARILHKSLNTFIESKAAFKCYDFTVIPLNSYITVEVMVSPQLLRFFLSNCHNIPDPWKFVLVKTFLTHHLAIHPPCRPGMHEYYLSVLNQHLDSFIFEKQLISDNFFDFVKRLKVSINEYALLDKQTSSAPATYTRKEAIDFLKQTCKASHKPKEEDARLQLDMLMFVFKYCVDILIHDNEVSRNTFTAPLVVKIVWGAGGDHDAEKPLNPHCQDIIGMYFKAPDFHQQDIAGYLTLLAEVMQKGDIPKKCYFWGLESNELVDAFVQKLTENEDLSEKILNTAVATLPSHIFRCQILQSLIFKNLIDGANFPKKTALSKKNSRPKKYFPLFEKKSRK